MADKTPETSPAVIEPPAASLPSGFLQGADLLAVALARAEVDQQVTTARAYPRSVTKALNNITQLATLDEETAAECMYALPRAGKNITGPSIRLAEIIASQWGNARCGTRIVYVDRVEKFIEAEGVFHDLETNMATTARVRRRISDRNGALFNDDMVIVTGNAASSIAKRNAITGGVPRVVWRGAYAAVQRVVRGEQKTLVERRDGVMSTFQKIGVSPPQIFAALDVAGVGDIGLDHLVTLTAMRSALVNGESTIDEMFPAAPAKAAAPEAAPRKDLKARMEELAGSPRRPGRPRKTAEPAIEKTWPASTGAGYVEFDPDTGEVIAMHEELDAGAVDAEQAEFDAGAADTEAFKVARDDLNEMISDREAARRDAIEAQEQTTSDFPGDRPAPTEEGASEAPRRRPGRPRKDQFIIPADEATERQDNAPFGRSRAGVEFHDQLTADLYAEGINVASATPAKLTFWLGKLHDSQWQKLKPFADELNDHAEETAARKE